MNNKKATNRLFENWFRNFVEFWTEKAILKSQSDRDKNLWIFSAWEGTKYADNAKYLFEYICAFENTITCVWITRNKNVQKEVQSKGHKCCLIGTNECETIERRAGVAIYTHAVDDFGDIPKIYGAYIVNLTHGTAGIKKTYYGIPKSNWLKECGSIVKAKAFNYRYADLTVATSEYCKRILKKESLMDKDTAIIGMPRNDFLNSKVDDLLQVFSRQFVEENGLKKEYIYITYMPTYRPTAKGQTFLENEICKLIDDVKLNEFLVSNHAKIIMKMHYLTDTRRMRFNENIILLEDTDITDVQKLLQLSSVLITDYSSCMSDFSLKKSGVILFTPDFKEYCRENGIYSDFAEILMEFGVSTSNELVEQIIRYIREPHIAKREAERLNCLFNEKINDVGSFSQLIYEYIKDKIGI